MYKIGYMKIFNNVIVNLHAVEDAKWLEKVFIFLKRHFNMVSYQDIEDYYYKDKKLTHSCLITFDDGDKSFYTHAFPLLKKYNIPAVVFVSPKATTEQINFWFQEIKGYNQEIIRQIMNDKKYFKKNISDANIGLLFKTLSNEMAIEVINEYKKLTRIKDKKCVNMNLEQLLDLDASNLIEIGAHTMNHPILANENDLISKCEIINSINELEILLKKKIRCFAYPNGKFKNDYGFREIEILKKTNVKLAFTTQNKGFKKHNNRFQVPRTCILDKEKIMLLYPHLVFKEKCTWVRKLFRWKNDSYHRKHYKKI